MAIRTGGGLSVNQFSTFHKVCAVFMLLFVLTAFWAPTHLLVGNLNGILFADQFSSITAAIAALPANGGTVVVSQDMPFDAGGIFLSSANQVRLVFDQGIFTYAGTGKMFSCNNNPSVIIEGSGRDGNDGTTGTTFSLTNTSATYGLYDTGCSGLTVRDVNFIGPGQGVGSTIGAYIAGTRTHFWNVSFSQFGSHGLLIGDSVGHANANEGHFDKLRSASNGGNGITLVDSNGQGQTFTSCDLHGNLGDGVNIANSANEFYGCNTDTNTGDDFHFVSGAGDNYIIGFFGNANSAAGIVYDSGANNNIAINLGTASETVTDNGTGNRIFTPPNWNKLSANVYSAGSGAISGIFTFNNGTTGQNVTLVVPAGSIGTPTVTLPQYTASVVAGEFCGATSGTVACTPVGTAVGTFHGVGGAATLSSGSAVISSLLAYTATSSASCWANDTTTIANPAKAVLSSSTAVTITGTASDVISWGCIGY